MEIEKDMVRYRVLYELKDEVYPNIREGVIREVSPDGEYVRFSRLYPKRGEVWYRVDNVEILSILEKYEEVEMEDYL